MPRLKDKVQQSKRPPVQQYTEPSVGQGQYSDRVAIDPFTRKWFYRHETNQTPSAEPMKHA